MGFWRARFSTRMNEANHFFAGCLFVDRVSGQRTLNMDRTSSLTWQTSAAGIVWIPT
ncbi:hypothetical protein PF003_g2604 [Phytophthora fragariae]|nr:hypothetical protein PF003_g2604 [Phytophthora fragariae]